MKFSRHVFDKTCNTAQYAVPERIANFNSELFQDFTLASLHVFFSRRCTQPHY